MIQLMGYKYPEKGSEYTSEPVWVNPELICSMHYHEVIGSRNANGVMGPKVRMTSITFAAAYAEDQVGLTVCETPEQILKIIHFWKLDNVPGYKELHS